VGSQAGKRKKKLKKEERDSLARLEWGRKAKNGKKPTE